MSFFQRLYDVMPASVVIACGVGLGAIVLLFGYNWLAARREDREELARWEPVEVPVTDRRPADPPDVAAVALVADDHRRAMDEIMERTEIRAVQLGKSSTPKRLNRHKAKVRRKK